MDQQFRGYPINQNATVARELYLVIEIKVNDHSKINVNFMQSEETNKIIAKFNLYNINESINSTMS